MPKKAFIVSPPLEPFGCGNAVRSHGDTVVADEERSGDYVHGHDNRGRGWTDWDCNGRTYVWPTR
jgi:hypothetical protein